MYEKSLTDMILVWIGGIAAVQGLTEKLKALWKDADQRLSKILNYLASVVVAVAVSGLFLYLNGLFSVKALFLHAIPIWLMATGIYDAFRR